MITTKYDKDKNIVYVVNEGLYTIRDIVDVCNDITRDYLHIGSLYNVDDFTSGEFQFQLNSVLVDLDHMKDAVTEMSNQFDHVFTALVFRKIPNEALLNFFLNLRKPKNYHLKVFYDIEMAKKWLMEMQLSNQ